LNDQHISGRRLRLGMVGGGEGAYIGGIHRFAARLDDQFELVAGAFDAVPARGHAFAATAFIDPDRSYDDFRRMAESAATASTSSPSARQTTPISPSPRRFSKPALMSSARSR
jgi:hypothetical protein